MEVDPAAQMDGSGQPLAGRYDDVPAARPRARFDGCADRLRTVVHAVADRTVVGDRDPPAREVRVTHPGEDAGGTTLRAGHGRDLLGVRRGGGRDTGGGETRGGEERPAVGAAHQDHSFAGTCRARSRRGACGAGVRCGYMGRVFPSGSMPMTSSPRQRTR